MLARPQFALASLAALLVTLALAAQSTSAAERPNVVLVMCDDLGWGDVGFNGATTCRTPHLDALAADSLVFDRFYAAAPVCSPTRGSALTGRHPFRYGIVTANAGHMKPEEVTLAEVLGEQGYATGHFGKWHLGTLTRETTDANRGGPRGVAHYSTPDQNGFDVYFSTESKVPTWDPMLRPPTFDEGESLRYGWIPVDERQPVVEANAYGTRYWDGEESRVTENLRGDNSRVIMDRATAFIEEAARAEQPFFAVIWFHTPHLPVVTGRDYRSLYAEVPLEEQLYYGCITAMDEQMGRLRSALGDLGVESDTMLWFCSDNGPEVRTPGSAGPFRGRKRSLYEGGVRVPALLHWPARIDRPRRTDFPCVTSDYFPTVVDALGLEPVAPSRPIDGVSLMPLIENAAQKRPRPIGFRTRQMATLSDNQYKLVRLGRGDDLRYELYDLVADPDESEDLAADHPDRVEAMAAQLTAWCEACDRSARGGDYDR